MSVGVALTGSRETAPADLLRRADAALYLAKQQAGPSWRLAAALDPVPSPAPEKAGSGR